MFEHKPLKLRSVVIVIPRSNSEPSLSIPLRPRSKGGIV
jgi:hypothetical protein